MEKDAKIYVAGHNGLVGQALVRCLRQAGHHELILRSRAELDLRDQASVRAFFAREKPRYVFLAAAKVGGILANSSQPLDFILNNLQITTNVMDAAQTHGTHKLLFLGSSCIYPKFAPQPIREESLLSGPLEPTNEWYAVAKIAGIKLGQAYRRQCGFNVISAMPTNLYGPGDNFDPVAGHVIPGLLNRFHKAKTQNSPQVTIWGTGKPLREFLHVDDLAGACLFLMERYDEEEHVNVCSGEEISILDLAGLIAEVVGYTGHIITDPGKPDGTPRKLMDGGRMTALGWRPSIPLRQGLEQTYAWYRNQIGARYE